MVVEKTTYYRQVLKERLLTENQLNQKKTMKNLSKFINNIKILCGMEIPIVYVVTQQFKGLNEDNPQEVYLTIHRRDKMKEDLGLYKRMNQTIKVDDYFWENVCICIGNFLDTCVYHIALQKNLQDMQNIVDSIIEEHNLHFTVKFKIGWGVFEVSDTFIAIGISEEIVKHYKETLIGKKQDNLLTDYIDVVRYYDIIEMLSDSLKACMHPIEWTQMKLPILEEWGIYKGLLSHTLISQAAPRKLETLREGIGYICYKGIIALVKKQPVDTYLLEELTSKLSPEEYIITYNEKATIQEKKKGYDYMLYTFVLKPHTKRYMLLKDISMKELLVE